MRNYMNLQGFVRDENYWKEFYGERFETAILAEVKKDEDGEWVEV